MTTDKTLAEQFRSRRQADYADPREFFDILNSVDSRATIGRVDGCAVVMFSDGSQYRLGING